ncbi:hypothetical protein, no similarity [Maudiozyma saulgeensis]|uniref:Uncharacterized protein n=1 Tax=Maudiozyma saulgeensis TaxID=1789683 RepID=A0A1X7QXA9_9SACH|nr:hypothetical protein, no similarity [Kazachstania saulgeensis]
MNPGKRFRNSSSSITTTKPLQIKSGNTINSSTTTKNKLRVPFRNYSPEIEYKPNVKGERLQFFDKTNEPFKDISCNETEMISCTSTVENKMRYKVNGDKTEDTSKVGSIIKIIPTISSKKNKKQRDRSLKFEDFDQPPNSTSTPISNNSSKQNEVKKSIDDSEGKNQIINSTNYRYTLHQAPEPFKNWDVNSIKDSPLLMKPVEYQRSTLYQSYKPTQVVKICIDEQNDSHLSKDNQPQILNSNTEQNILSITDQSTDRSDSIIYMSSGGNATYNNSDE